MKATTFKKRFKPRNLASFLEDFRKSENDPPISQRALAKKLGVSYTTIQRLERGEGDLVTLIALLIELDYTGWIASALHDDIQDTLKGKRSRKGVVAHYQRANSNHCGKA